MITIQVHRLTYRIITRLHGSASIHLDKASPLVPILTAPSRISRGQLTDQIEVTGSPRILASIDPDAGHNLYMIHKHQLMDWITLHVSMGQMVWPAMMMYYEQMGMTIDDLDPASVYRQWYRSQSRTKSKKSATNTSSGVIEKLRPRRSALDQVMEDVAVVIHRHPETFYKLDGQPDPNMIRKAIMHSMYADHGWRQTEIVSAFGRDKSRVSRAINSFTLV